MELTLIAVVGVVAVVAVEIFSDWLGVAAPLSLVVVGIALSFIPGIPRLSIQPDWILAGVLPPLLYSASVSMPAQDFRRNFKTISALAVVLVAITTLAAGWLFHELLHGISWPASFALGAVISPTDPVAATSIGRKLGLPSRLLTVIEGEGLVNDASALVLLRSAIAAMAGSVSLLGVAWQFVYSVVMAVAIGLAVGLISAWLRGKLNNSVQNTAISFVIPFIAFVPAEAADASGALAVVVAGLVTGYQGVRYLRAQDRLAEAVNWRTLSFLLESGVFLLMGLDLKTLVDEVDKGHLSVRTAVLTGLLATVFVITARIVAVAPVVGFLYRETRRAAEAKPRLEQMQTRLADPRTQERLSERRYAAISRRVSRVMADVDFQLREAVGWRGGVVLAWAGMRGAITVAAAQTLPGDTPLRSELTLIAYVVAAGTLLLQGLTMPAVIRAAKVPGDDDKARRAEYADLLAELSGAAVRALDDPGLTGQDGEPADPAVLARVRAEARISDTGDPRPRPDQQQREQYSHLAQIVLAAERDALLAARSLGTYSSPVLARAQNELDFRQAQIERRRG
jgi:monovalent cation/hydrogen antiporter